MATKKEIGMLNEYCQGFGINVGCGRRHMAGVLNIDTSESADPEMYADASMLPFRSGLFDFVVSSHCLEHVREAPLIVLCEWLRVLKKGGILAFIVPDGFEGTISLGAEPGTLIESRHVHVFTGVTLRVLISYASAELVRQELIERPQWKTNTILTVVRKVGECEVIPHDCLKARYLRCKEIIKTINLW